MKRIDQKFSSPDYFKASSFNIVSDHPDSDDLILYNSASGARVIVPSTEWVTLSGYLQGADKFSESCIHKETLNVLLENGFVVDVDFDEIEAVRAFQNNSKRNSKRKRATVILTRKCNLGCGYCYQEKSEPDAEPDLNLIRHSLSSLMEKNGIFQVTWFGGEPTLKLKEIELISKSLINHADKINCEYTATISTNGVLLTDRTIEVLSKCRVRHYQISLDGPFHIQDKRRPALNGKPTFHKITDGLSRLVETDAKIVIKMIIDTLNWRTLPELFDELVECNLLNHLQFAIQETESKFAAAQYGQRFTSLEKFAMVKIYLLSELKERGYLLSAPTTKPEFCAATSEYSTIIDMGGNLYRCATEKENLVGEVDSNGVQNITRKDYQSIFLEHDVGATPECHKCSVLPICGGGCSLAAADLADRQTCSYFRVAIADYLQLLEGKKYSIPRVVNGEEVIAIEV